jgi:hypothetical protein
MDLSRSSESPPPLPSMPQQRGSRVLFGILLMGLLWGSVFYLKALVASSQPEQPEQPKKPQKLPFEVSVKRFSQLRTGMSREEVEELLGQPTSDEKVDLGPSGGGSFSKWEHPEDKNQWIKVFFLLGELAGKSLSEHEKAEQE